MHRPSKALEGYSPFKTTDLRDPVLGEIAERQGVTPAQVVIRAHRPRSRRDPKSASPKRIASNSDVFGFALDDAGPPNRWPIGRRVRSHTATPYPFVIFHSDYCSSRSRAATTARFLAR